MKVEIECLSCIIHRGYLEIAEATKNPDLQFKAASALLEYMAKEFKPDAVAAVLGTVRDRIIKQISSNLDVYAERKRASNQVALRLLPSIKNLIEKETSQEKRFRKACLAAIVGNIIEFDIPEHEVNLNQLEQLIVDAEKDLAIDEILEIYEEAKKTSSILFLTDNAGEIAFDKLLVSKLKQLSAKVIVVVKDGPILNDATLEDAKAVSMYDVADAVITTGADAVGMPLPEERSEEFIKAYDEADFVIAKGMGYVETLTEIKLKQPLAFLLRTKCNPVARYFRVSRGKNVAKLVKP
ncbi:MAG: ARMT1-like domain-containing protein [Candidatus Bathyarchaeota archaeon]|nr:ARMT1-like domain-containing protein [Candidatus Bathyarchaeota archaeon]MDH5495538.1 ARMT1-like domain-containing protein [Candidatus Bathyarchaeota archaeon]